MNKRKYNHHFLFNKSNFILMFIGIGLMLLGYVAMIGGGYTDPMTPNYDVKYGFRTTVLAPILILLGLVINGYAIMKKPSDEQVSWVQDNVFNSDEISTRSRRGAKEVVVKTEEVVVEEKSKSTIRKQKRRKGNS